MMMHNNSTLIIGKNSTMTIGTCNNSTLVASKNSILIIHSDIILIIGNNSTLITGTHSLMQRQFEEVWIVPQQILLPLLGVSQVVGVGVVEARSGQDALYHSKEETVVPLLEEEERRDKLKFHHCTVRARGNTHMHC